MRTNARESRRRATLADEREKKTKARKKTMATVAHCSVVGTARRRRKQRGEQSRGKRTPRGNCRTLMARPEPVGEAMPTRTVARPPFWAGYTRDHHGQGALRSFY